MGIQHKSMRVEVGSIPTQKKKDTIYFSTFEEMSKVLNPNRVTLLEIIKKEQPESIYKLASLVKRDQGNVTKDVNMLKKHGFIDIVKTKEGDRVKSQPKLESEAIEMVIKLGAGAFGLAKEMLENVSEEFKDKKLETNKKYAKEKYEKVAKNVKKPIKEIVKKVAKEFDIVVKEEKE